MNLLEKRILKKYPNEKIKVLTYTKMKSAARVECEKCGTIYNMSAAEGFVRKNKVCICQNCAPKDKKMECQERINKKFPNENILIIDYNGAKAPIKLKCLKCGTEIQLEYAQNLFLEHKKRICPHCFPNKREAFKNTLNNFINDFIPNNKKFKDFILLERINSETLIESTCIFCGKKNYKTIYDYQRGRGCTCQCTNTIMTAEEYQKKLGIGYSLMSEYKGLDHSVLIKHELCGFTYKTSARHVSCPKCKGSNGEKQIRSWLKKYDFNFIEQYQVKIKNHLLRFDFYLPDQNIYIEYQDEQYYKPIEYFGGEETYQKQVYYDNLKREFAQGKLIEIKYTDNILLKLNEQVTQNP